MDISIWYWISCPVSFFMFHLFSKWVFFSFCQGKLYRHYLNIKDQSWNTWEMSALMLNSENCDWKCCLVMKLIFRLHCWSQGDEKVVWWDKNNSVWFFQVDNFVQSLLPIFNIFPVFKYFPIKWNLVDGLWRWQMDCK